MTKIKLGTLRVAVNILQQLDLKEEHNKFVIIKNLSEFNIIIDEANDEVRYKNIELAEVNEKNHIIKDEKGNLIFNRENTILLEKFTKELNNKLYDVKLIKFRNNDEINKILPSIKSFMEFLLVDLIEPKEVTIRNIEPKKE